jgi:hypothetical protein
VGRDLDVLVHVAPEGGVLGLVEQRQGNLGKVDDLDVEAALLSGGPGNPLGARLGQPGRAGCYRRSPGVWR